MPVHFPIHLKRHARLEGTLTLRSGTRIGGSKDEIEIGGLDNPVIRDPLSKEPYLPGSSLKGKLRSLLEQRYPRNRPRSDRPCGCAQEDCPVCTLFGPHQQMKHNLGPSRLIVRDASLTAASRERLQRLQEEGLPMTGSKTETMINRETGVAGGGSLRTQEFVPKDTIFEINMSLRVFEGDDEQQLQRWVDEAIALLQDDTLGGSGTRGYGWVKIDHKWA